MPCSAPAEYDWIESMGSRNGRGFPKVEFDHENHSSMDHEPMMSAVDRRRAVTGIVVAATAFMLPQGGAANTGEEAEFARAILTKVYDLFLNQNYSDEEVEQRLIVLFDETFDVPTVSRLPENQTL